MSYFFYPTHNPRRAGGFDLANADAMAYWQEHTHCFLVLRGLLRRSTSFETRAQALREMEIAERKIAYWERHPNFDQAEALRLMVQIRRNAANVKIETP